MQTTEQTLERAAARAATRLAAGAAAAPSRPGGALRLGLPDPARRPTSSRSTAPAARTRTSPTCTPGARSTCRAPAGSASIRPPACSPAKATSRSSCTPEPVERRADQRRGRRLRGRVQPPHGGAPRSTNRRASPSPTPRRSGTAIAALGDQVDGELQRRDVRLTMGGEPTFVGIDDRDARRMEHRRAGPDQASARRRPAVAPARQYAPGGFVHFGQGKWYPGEQLPRWALDLLLAQGRRAGLARPVAVRRRAQATTASTRDDARALPSHGSPLRLGVDRRSTSSAGYEDTFYYLWRERQLPVNVDPFDARLDDEMERERLRRVFTQGSMRVGRLRAAAGATAPTGDVADRPWYLRGERMYLIPGDSPMGYRLPLESLPWVSEHRLPVPARARSVRAAPAAAAASVARQTSRSRPPCLSGWPCRSNSHRRGCEAHRAGHAGGTRDRSRANDADAAPSRLQSAGVGRPHARSAPRSATACSTSSCRRCRTPADYLELAAAVESTASRARACRCCSKAIRRRTTRASSSCRSRRTPA